MDVDRNLEIARILKRIEWALPHYSMPKETLAYYVAMLQDIDPVLLGTALDRVLKTTKFPPALGEIRRAAAEMALDLPGAEEAWIEVLDAVRRFNRYAPRPVAWSSPVVAKAVAAVGGVEAIAQSEAIEILAGQFRRAYESLAERETVRLQISFGAAPDLRLLPGGNEDCPTVGARGRPA